jgi:hypothetical protein
MPSASGDKNNVAVGQRVSRLVKLTVSDNQKIDFDSALIPEKFQYRAGEPVKIRVIFSNKGNVEIKPNLQLKIVKDDAEIFNAIIPYPENAGAVKPLQQKEFTEFAVWQTTGQTPGQYAMHMTVLLDGKVIKTEPFTFTIVSGSAMFLSSILTVIRHNAVVFGLLFLVGLLAIWQMIRYASKFRRTVL